MKNLKTFDSSYFICKNHFNEDGTQNYLVFQPVNRYFKVITNSDYISLWKSKELLVEELKKLKSFDLDYFIGKIHFNEYGSQHYLVFQPIFRYFTLNSNWITEWIVRGIF